MTLGRIWLLAAGVFALDLPFPVGYAVPLLYIPLVVATLRVGPRDYAALVASVATVLTIVEAPIIHGGANAEIGLFNRGLALVAVWITAAGVTRHRRLQAALRRQEADAELGRMTAVMAHELRNPLAGIRAALQVLDIRLAGDARGAVVTTMIARLDRLAGIVESLLSYVRPVDVTLSTVAVTDLLADARTAVATDARSAAIAVEVIPVHGEVRTDPAHVATVLSALLRNAVHPSTRATRVVLSAQREGEFWQLRVADNGAGIPPADRARLGDPFFTSKADGPGLGLATARRLLAALEGSVSFTFPDTGGTVATVTLPAGPRRAR